jgi:hypothetical protein
LPPSRPPSANTHVEMSGERPPTTHQADHAGGLTPEDHLNDQDTRQTLQQTLSSGYSTASTLALRLNQARCAPVTNKSLRDIGRGSCGSVFEVPGTSVAIKKGANVEAIWNDYNLANTAYNSYLACAGLVSRRFPGRRAPSVPAASFYYSPDSDDFSTANLQRFPMADQTRAAIFHLDRISPVSSTTR